MDRSAFSYREGSTIPFRVDLGEIDPLTNIVSAENINVQSASEIAIYCQSRRFPSVVVTFKLSDDEIEVEQDEDGYYRRLKITPPASRLLYFHRAYDCYIEVTNGGVVSTWPEGGLGGSFTIQMLQKLS